MKKIFYIGLIGLLGFITPTNAQPVSEGLARHVATIFWNSHRPNDVKPATMVTTQAISGLNHLHIIDINGEGFVIVAGDQRVRPILAYSFDSPCSKDLNPETGYWLRGYEAQIAEVAQSNATQRENILQEWGQLILATNPDEPLYSLENIPAMMTTRWNQSPIYNNLCPYDSIHNARTVVGCVATAMAQIMRYWRYPAYGEGFYAYNYRHYGEISADFGNTSYLWHIMPNVCNEFCQESEINATATISYHCGVGVKMMYGTSAEGGSGAYSECGPWTSHCAVNAFVDYFKYDSSINFASRDGIADATWLAILDNEVEGHRPVYYHGSDSTGGHAFVLDGSDISGRYHINWGWGGSYNGYYFVDTLSPGAGGTGGNATYTFNMGQGIIYNIRPAHTEVFDTVDYLDSICSNTTYVYFRDYKLLVHNVKNRDTLLHHFDTVFRYHLKVIDKKKVYLNPNNGDVSSMYTYCPATGYTLPECSFSKTNCIFTGWCRNRDGNDVIYQPGETAWFNNSPTFYALWVDTTAAVEIDTPEDEIIAVWPTMTSEQVNIAMTDAETFTINVIDNWGRVVIQKESVGRKAKISVASLPAGTYTIQIIAKGTIYKSRIIKL